MALSGRGLRWSRDSVQIAGARSDAVTISAEPVDITDKDDDGWRTLLADVSLRSVTASVSGVMKSDTLASVSVGTASALLEACDLEIDGIYTMTGDFHLSNLTITGEQADAVLFEAEMQGSGTFVQTVAPYNIEPPTATGLAEVGEVLSSTTGTWGGDATITYSRPWEFSADGVNWSATGIGSTTYTIGAGDLGGYLRKAEVATNSVGTSTAYSNVLGPVTA